MHYHEKPRNPVLDPQKGDTDTEPFDDLTTSPSTANTKSCDRHYLSDESRDDTNADKESPAKKSKVVGPEHSKENNKPRQTEGLVCLGRTRGMGRPPHRGIHRPPPHKLRPWHRNRDALARCPKKCSKAVRPVNWASRMTLRTSTDGPLNSVQTLRRAQRTTYLPGDPLSIRAKVLARHPEEIRNPLVQNVILPPLPQRPNSKLRKKHLTLLPRKAAIPRLPIASQQLVQSLRKGNPSRPATDLPANKQAGEAVSPHNNWKQTENRLVPLRDSEQM